jgi:hypothetical protein
MGLYDKGKTFLLNSLANTLLESGKIYNTEGLSFKYVEKDSFRHVLLDTQGMESPVTVVSHSDPSSVFAAHKATELFLRDVACNLADMFIVVVNDLTYSDQLFLSQLAKTVKESEKEIRQIIVVHNFRTIKDEEEANLVWKVCF